MAGRPGFRDKDERALAGGETTTAETPLKAKKTFNDNQKKYQTRERMLELIKIREEKRARGELGSPEGRARTKFTKAEKEAAALQELMPKALKVLKEQLDDKDPRVRQTAAIKVLEYNKGKPTQMIKQDIDQRVSAIRFETAALNGAVFAPVIDAPLLLEEEDEEVGDGDGEAD